MFKIDLAVYYTSKQYFILYDILFKELAINKEPFLISKKINPSSYRRARTKEQQIGSKINTSLAKMFDYKELDVIQLGQIEKRLNQIFFNIYYKIYDTYEDDQKFIKMLIKDQYLIFPILKLFDLLMILHQPNNEQIIISTLKPEFEELRKYLPFFTYELQEIFDLISIFFERGIVKGLKSKNYNQGLFYYEIAVKLLDDNEYLESLYYANLCQEALLKDGNYKRLIYLNSIIMSNYLEINNYSACLELGTHQLLTLKSFNFLGYDLGYEYHKTIHFIAISALALEKYDQVIDVLTASEILSIIDKIILMIAYYHSNLDNYHNFFNYTVNNCREHLLFINLDSYLTSKDKQAKEYLKMHLSKHLLELLNIKKKD